MNRATSSDLLRTPGESRPLLSHGLARATASFARLKALSGPSYDATAASEAGGEATSPGPRRETWHRCQADVGVAPALLAHFALGTGTFLQGCVPGAPAAPAQPSRRAQAEA